MLQNRTFRIVLVDAEAHVGLGIQQSVRFSKEVTYDGSEVSVQIDNNNLVTEEQAAVESIQATPASIKLFLGQSKTFAVKAKYADGTTQYVTLDARCESSNPSVATVRDGIVYAGQTVGQADINVTYTDGMGTDHHTTVSVEATIPSNLYVWKAYDWYKNRVSDRLGASDITYSTKDNTITITKTGGQNIALRYKDQKYMEPGMKYLVGVATDVSKTKSDSQLWFINGRWVNIVNPDDIRNLKDGRIMISWAIDENTGYELTGETVFGLTSTNSQGRSVISYVGFTSNLNKLAKELNDAVGINEIHATHTYPQSIYAPNGTPRKQLAHGVNIVKSGYKVSKILLK
jgi:alpha-D-xyloside xylohydrolase